MSRLEPEKPTDRQTPLAPDSIVWKDYAREGLRELIRAWGMPAYRADQISAWIYQRGVHDFDAMTDLPAALRSELAGRVELDVLECVELLDSRDGTRKARLRARDGAEIESVCIPEDDRRTLCVSSQVGCPLACSFCATGSLGFTRNLRTAEIVDQLCRMREGLAPDQEITNVVFMGMGEPLLNLAAVVEAVRILIDPKGFGLAPRRVTVSTAGVVPQIGPLLESVPVNLAVSLHATTDAVRDELVPLNRRFPIEALFDALRSCKQISRRHPVFFEYTLIDGVNDSVEDARRLAALLARLPSKVNVIPMNPHVDSPARPPSAERIDRFMAGLAAGGATVTLRRPRGADIDAACGQLARRRSARPSAPHAA